MTLNHKIGSEAIIIKSLGWGWKIGDLSRLCNALKGGFPGVLWQAAKTNPQAAKTNPQAAKSIHRRQKQLAAP